MEKNENTIRRKSRNSLKVYEYQIAIDLTGIEDEVENVQPTTTKGPHHDEKTVIKHGNDEVQHDDNITEKSRQITINLSVDDILQNEEKIKIHLQLEKNSIETDHLSNSYGDQDGGTINGETKEYQDDINSSCLSDDDDESDENIENINNLLEKCENIASNRYSKRKRTKSDKGLEPYLCHTCGKVMRSKNSLKQHKRTHTGEKPYHCNICNKSFSHGLTYHKRSHTGERPYKCKQCDSSFRTSYHLGYHIKLIHTLEREFPCELCTKRFITGYYLKKHMRSHMGVKDQQCSICDRNLSSKSALSRHIKLKHLKKPLNGTESAIYRDE